MRLRGGQKNKEREGTMGDDNLYTNEGNIIAAIWAVHAGRHKPIKVAESLLSWLSIAKWKTNEGGRVNWVNSCDYRLA